jgi:hypothetical protein
LMKASFRFWLRFGSGFSELRLGSHFSQMIELLDFSCSEVLIMGFFQDFSGLAC